MDNKTFFFNNPILLKTLTSAKLVFSSSIPLTKAQSKNYDQFSTLHYRFSQEVITEYIKPLTQIISNLNYPIANKTLLIHDAQYNRLAGLMTYTNELSYIPSKAISFFAIDLLTEHNVIEVEDLFKVSKNVPDALWLVDASSNNADLKPFFDTSLDVLYQVTRPKRTTRNTSDYLKDLTNLAKENHYQIEGFLNSMVKPKSIIILLSKKENHHATTTNS